MRPRRSRSCNAAAAGSQASFTVNALSYLPLIAVLYFWRRKPELSRLPPERLNRAIISGARYVIHSPAMRTVMLRSLLTGLNWAKKLGYISGHAITTKNVVVRAKRSRGKETSVDDK